MVKRCFVYNCRTGRKSDRNNEQKYSLFKAPSDKFLLEKWRESVPLRERELNSNDRICAKHFEKRYILPRFQQSIYGDFYEDHIRPKLTPDAVPTIFYDSESQVISIKSPKSLNEVPNTPSTISQLLRTRVEVNENDTVPICFKCLLGKCIQHAVFTAK